jgi:hypothetical protein
MDIMEGKAKSFLEGSPNIAKVMRSDSFLRGMSKNLRISKFFNEQLSWGLTISIIISSMASIP